MGTKPKIKEYIRQWEERCYYTGIPDEAPNELEANGLVPSYKRLCRAILKNDINLKSIGFIPKKSKYYSEIKRLEIESRLFKGKQLKLVFNQT